MAGLATVSSGDYYATAPFTFTSTGIYFRVMMGAFPLIIPNDPIMKMKIEEKAMSLMKNEIS